MALTNPSCMLVLLAVAPAYAFSPSYRRVLGLSNLSGFRRPALVDQHPRRKEDKDVHGRGPAAPRTGSLWGTFATCHRGQARCKRAPRPEGRLLQARLALSPRPAGRGHRHRLAADALSAALPHLGRRGDAARQLSGQGLPRPRRAARTLPGRSSAVPLGRADRDPTPGHVGAFRPTASAARQPGVARPLRVPRPPDAASTAPPDRRRHPRRVDLAGHARQPRQAIYLRSVLLSGSAGARRRVAPPAGADLATGRAGPAGAGGAAGVVPGRLRRRIGEPGAAA